MVTANVHGNREVKDKLRHFFSTGGFILVSDHVRMEVTLVGASRGSWSRVIKTGCGLHSYEVFCL